MTNIVTGGITWINEEVVFSMECNTSEFLQVMTAHDNVPNDNENTETNKFGDVGNTQINSISNKLT